MRPFIKAGVRIVLIYIFLDMLYSGLNQIFGDWAQINVYGTSGFNPWVPIGFLIAFLAVGTLILGLLWWKTDWLVRVLTGRQNVNTVAINMSESLIIQTAFRITGLVLVVWGLPDLLGVLGYYARINGLNSSLYDLTRDMANVTRWLIADGMKVVFGIVLLVGTRNTMKLLERLWDKAHMADHAPESTE